MHHQRERGGGVVINQQHDILAVTLIGAVMGAGTACNPRRLQIKRSFDAELGLLQQYYEFYNDIVARFVDLHLGAPDRLFQL
jgi:hypothetical protein